jgi:hypothetical protein
MPNAEAVRELFRCAQITDRPLPVQFCAVCVRPYCAELWHCLVAEDGRARRRNCGGCMGDLDGIVIPVTDVTDLWPGKNKFESQRLKVTHQR